MLLRNQSVLVVEDEFIIAYDLIESVQDAGGIALGPAESVRRALTILSSDLVTAAILDVNLRDGDVAPVAERLRDRQVPFVVHTGGILTPRLKTSFGRAPIFSKPTRSDRLISSLADEIGMFGADSRSDAGHHVLLIEDEPYTCTILEGYMRRFGFRSVDQAATEKGAIEAAHRQRPDLLIVDIGLREGDGLSAAAVIQAAFGTPWIVVTRNPDSTVGIDKALVVGKPFSVSTLQAAITAATTSPNGPSPRG